MNQQRIGNFIKTKRKEKNLTQEELASRLRVSNRTISKWENGHGMPDYSMILDLCKELDMSVNELLSGQELKSENYQTMLEENIIRTIEYNNKKRNKRSYKIIFSIILIILIILLIGYKCYLTNLYTNYEINDWVKNVTIEEKEIELNDKANTNVLESISIYIPEGFYEENDITKSVYVKTGCRLYVKGEEEHGAYSSMIQVCKELNSALIDDYEGEYGRSLDFFDIRTLLNKYNIYDYYDLAKYYLEHKEDKLNLLSKKDDLRLHYFMFDMFNINNENVKHYLHSSKIKGFTSVFTSPNNKELFLLNTEFSINNLAHEDHYSLRVYNLENGTLTKDDALEILSSIKKLG